MHLSDVFKYTQGLGQKGHQIGRKVGDALELLVMGMIHKNEELTKYLVIEDGVEGATTAEHKVEFSFYNLDLEGNPSCISEELFGIIECKKVGVEQTVKQSFKVWQRITLAHQFYQTIGYPFSLHPKNSPNKWRVTLIGEINGENNLKIEVTRTENDVLADSQVHLLNINAGQKILIGLDVENNFFLLPPPEKLSDIPNSVSKCVVVEVQETEHRNIVKIMVNESLPGPQTPEKAKQASFVSLDVRKKVTGHFDITENKTGTFSIHLYNPVGSGV